MTSPRYQRGSEWRKWDLQVHTPYSVLNNNFGDNFQRYAKQLLEKALKNKIAAVGVTDYFSIQGYTALRNLFANHADLVTLLGDTIAEEVSQILFIPNVELRTSIIVKNSNGTDSRVNFHVLFSDIVSPEDIEENFLHELHFTAEANPDSKDERWPLTIRNLTQLGKRLKDQHEKFQEETDVFIGMMNAVVDHTEVSQVLENKSSIFKDRYLLCLPCDEDLSNCSWDGQGHLARKLLIQKSHLLLSSNEGTRDFALGKKHSSQAEFIMEFKGLKPCIHSSDSHCYDKLFTPDNNRHTWIKADPTFNGLRQTLNEPEDRVFIGEIPPGIINRNKRKTRVIKSVGVRKLPTATTTEKWFDFEIPLNAELVAVIGNKGSGKSALSDILGLLGNTPRWDSFSFLNSARFRQPRDNKAHQFKASLTWMDDTNDAVPSLEENPNSESVEKVKYIPQNYLETICNEIGLGKGGRFYIELQETIFSHVPEAERMGFGTLEELLTYRSEETNKAIEQIVQELHECNTTVLAIEDKLTPNFRKGIEARLTEKARELKAHEQAKPREILKPNADSIALQQSKEFSEAIEKKQSELEAIEEEIKILRSNDSIAERKRTTAEKLIGKLNNLQRQFDSFVEEAKPNLEELKLNLNQIVALSIKTAPVEECIRASEDERKSISSKLDPEINNSLEHKRLKIVDTIEDFQSRLSAPERTYQAYLKTIKEWEANRNEIIGTEDHPESIKYLEKQLEELDALPFQYKRLKQRQRRKLLEIYREKQRLQKNFEGYYGAVQHFLKEHPLATREDFKLTFNVSMTESGFAEEFWNLINRRKVGPFRGEEESVTKMNSLLNNANFDSAHGTLRFTQTLLDKMEKHEGKPQLIKEQLKKGVTPQDFYDFIFSLGYLSPIYNLRWDGKTLEQLSPGERGNLLLIFYLLVDRKDIPLIIDQPEENLDNQTIFKTLVPCVKDAKKRRQIVIVTHNPNLAVVCDAEQIICAQIKKESNNTVIYTSGSIEDPTINRRIVDILEGTRPAFDKRDDKYMP